MRRLMVAAAVALAGTSAAVTAQQEGSLAKFSSQVQLVEVYATVTDERGELVTGLRQKDFQVYEDNRLQEISTFAAGEFPLTVALGVDRSWSMAGKPLELAKQASRAFLSQLKTGDRSMVVAISSIADVITPLSADRIAQGRAISVLDPWSTTALRDADHRRARSTRARIGTTGARLVFRRQRPLQHCHGSGGDRARPPQQRLDISDHDRQTAPNVSGRARRHDRRPFFSLEGCNRAREDALDDRARAPLSISARLRANDPIEEGVHEWRPIRVALTGNHAGVARACTRRVYDE